MKAAVIKHLRDRHNEATAAATRARPETGIQTVQTQLRAASIHESLYSNRTLFIRCTVREVDAVGAADVVDTMDAADAVGAADTVDTMSAVDMADVDTVKGSLGIWECSIGCL